MGAIGKRQVEVEAKVKVEVEAKVKVEVEVETEVPCVSATCLPAALCGGIACLHGRQQHRDPAVPSTKLVLSERTRVEGLRAGFAAGRQA